MTDLTPRAPVAEDYEPLADLWDQRWHDAHDHCSPPELAALRTRPDFLRRLHGFGTGLKIIGPIGHPTGLVAVRHDHLDQLYVARSLEGSGAADILVAEGLRMIRSAGHGRALLECNTGNLRAAAYYRKSGWTERGVERVMLDSSAGPFPLDCLVFERPV